MPKETLIRKNLNKESLIKVKLNEIASKYIQNEYYDEKVYDLYYYDKDEKEFELELEFKEFLIKSNIKFHVLKTQLYHRASLDVYVISVSWIENDNLFLENYKIISN